MGLGALSSGGAGAGSQDTPDPASSLFLACVGSFCMLGPGLGVGSSENRTWDLPDACSQGSSALACVWAEGQLIKGKPLPVITVLQSQLVRAGDSDLEAVIGTESLRTCFEQLNVKNMMR